jgi:hypothetical protein
MKVQTRHVCHHCGSYAPTFEADEGGWVCAKHGPPEKSEIEPSSSSGLPPTSVVAPPSPTSVVAPPSSTSLEPVVGIGVGVGIGTSSPRRDKPKSGSQRFAELEKDAEKLGCRPLVMRLPDDLSTAQALVMKDYLYVAGVYEALDGRTAVLAEGVPYSKRWRTEVLGLSDITVHRVLQALAKRGVLEDRGETDPADGYPRGDEAIRARPAVPLAMSASGRSPRPRRDRA